VRTNERDNAAESKWRGIETLIDYRNIVNPTLITTTAGCVYNKFYLSQFLTAD